MWLDKSAMDADMIRRIEVFCWKLHIKGLHLYQGKHAWMGQTLENWWKWIVFPSSVKVILLLLLDYEWEFKDKVEKISSFPPSLTCNVHSLYFSFLYFFVMYMFILYSDLKPIYSLIHYMFIPFQSNFALLFIINVLHVV